MIRYAITESLELAGGAGGLRGEVSRWAGQGVDFIQLREKGLAAGELARLGRGLLEAVRGVPGSRAKVLVNSRADVALAIGADGVHLTAAEGELRPDQVRELYEMCGLPSPVVSASVHTLGQVEAAALAGVDLMLFGPVFGKTVRGVEVVRGVGLEILREACARAGDVPVLALGGVTEGNVAECLAVGAAGFAGIRAFL